MWYHLTFWTFVISRCRKVLHDSRRFRSNVSLFFFSGNSGCFFPEVDIDLGETIALAREVLTTSRLTLRTDITFCNAQQSIQWTSWEISEISSETVPPFRWIGNGTEFVLNPRMNCTDCYPAYLYLRFTASLKGLDGRTIQGFGLFKVDQPDLVVKIRGPTEVDKGIGEIFLDASESRDPDIFDKRNLTFTWFCKHKKDRVFLKEACLHGRTASNGKVLVVDVNRLKSNHTQKFKLVISKGTRTKMVIHALKVRPSVNFTFR